eukprot:2023023-Rhodomonas_salina.1
MAFRLSRGGMTKQRGRPTGLRRPCRLTTSCPPSTTPMSPPSAACLTTELLSSRKRVLTGRRWCGARLARATRPRTRTRKRRWPRCCGGSGGSC